MAIKYRAVTLALSLAAVSSVASGYYNWIYFANHNGPFTPIPAKIDLNALTNNTVSFFISDEPPRAMVPGDTFASLVSQIRAAADAWNHAPGSSLRLTFGGIETIGATQQTAPGIDVVFDDDMPPGLLAQTRPSLPADVSFIVGGASFVPISRSRIQLRSDLTVYQQASYYDSVFLTIVHEFGHAIGLQHTLTSGVMSTDVTRATTKASPLAADDIAGVAMLYPAAGYLAGTGAISGVVQQNGSGVNLASVVALSTTGIAISAMTNPDGTFTIGGVPSGQYYVYAHPLPPAQQGEAYPDNIYPPVDIHDNPFPANTGMDTQFFLGGYDWTKAGVVTVTAGTTTHGINFLNMQKRAGPAVYDVQTYAYLGQPQIAVPTPSLLSGSRLYLVFTAPGVAANGKLTPGLNVTAIGGAAKAEAGTLAYFANGYAKVVLDINPVAAPTPVALALTVPNDLYVLPAALTVVSNPAPTISSVTSAGAADGQGDPLVTIVGTNLSAGTRVVFDGAAAEVESLNSDGSLTVVAPPATANYTASVEALSNDGQTSSQLLGLAAPPVYTYLAPPNPSILVNTGLLVPGSDSEVDIIGLNTNFIDGQLSIGFANSDVVVRNVWVLNPQRVLLNVTVSRHAQSGPVQLTVASGLQMETLNAVLQIQAFNPGAMSLHVPVLNQLTGLPGIPAGGGAIINTSGLPQNLTTWSLYIDGKKATFSMGGGNQIWAQVPAGLPLGAAVVQLIPPSGGTIAAVTIPPVVMQIDAPPPTILGVVNSIGVPIDSAHPARPGDLLTVTVAGLADPAVSAAPIAASIHISVGGLDHIASGLLQGSQPGITQIQFALSPVVPFGPSEPLTVGLGTRISAPVPVTIIPGG